MPSAGEPWEELEYRELLERFPLSGHTPSGPDALALARRLGRAVGAIEAQWDDARSYCLGRESTVASDQLKSYLDRNGLCRELR
jgi:hypothetical protein